MRSGATEEAKKEQLGAVAIKPPGWDRTGWEAFRYFIYDPDKGTILSRTPKSWILITIFYIIYYSCLAAFWCGCLFIFGMTLPEKLHGPKWQQNGGLIGSNPGRDDIRVRNGETLDKEYFKNFSFFHTVSCR